MPSLKQAIARSIDSTLRSLRKTSNSAEKVISWIKQLMVISVHSQSLALPSGNVRFSTSSSSLVRSSEVQCLRKLLSSSFGLQRNARLILCRQPDSRLGEFKGGDCVSIIIVSSCGDCGECASIIIASSCGDGGECTSIIIESSRMVGSVSSDAAVVGIHFMIMEPVSESESTI